MNDTNTWPDPERPGVPLNPERNVWHWIDDGRGPECAEFLSVAGTWVKVGTEVEYGPAYAARWRYFGPALTPAEVEAAIVFSRCYALEEAALIATTFADAYQNKEMAKRGQNKVFDFATIVQCGRETSRIIAAAIRALAKEPGNE